MFGWLFGKTKEKDIIKTLDNTFFEIETKNNKRIVKLIGKNGINIDKINIIKFGTENCPACKMFRQPLKMFEKNNKEIIDTYEVDISLFPDLGNLLNIRGVPANFIFVKGELYNMSNGASLEAIVQQLKPLGISIK